jgi:hypothetical protein
MSNILFMFLASAIISFLVALLIEVLFRVIQWIDSITLFEKKTKPAKK